MQQLLNVLTPSATYDLVTLEEMKMKLMIPDSNTQWDALLQELITNLSDTIAKLCCRVFAYEGVDECFYQLNDETHPPTRRLYLSRWPVVLSDITAINQTVDGSGVVTDLLPLVNQNWFLEEATGTLYQRPDLGPWTSTVDVIYSGGYQLPDGAPGSIKFCVEALLRESYMSWIRNPAMFGVRQLSHKESRIGYYGPNMFPTVGLPATWTVVQGILRRYIRWWI